MQGTWDGKKLSKLSNRKSAEMSGISKARRRVMVDDGKQALADFFMLKH